MAEGEIEYESDPEEAKLSLKMRRREASDDEEEEEGGVEGGDRREKPPWRIDDSDVESEGGAAEYEDDLEEEEEEEYDLDEVYVEKEIEEIEEMVAVGKIEWGEGGLVVVEEKRGHNAAGDVDDEDNNFIEDGHEEEKKEEPFSVPTAGAFYMHDDRFRDNARGRRRHTLGGRKLWQSKDDMKWGHDKYEEFTVQERHYGEPRRSSSVRNRGRGINRGMDRVYAQGNRPSSNNIENNNNQSNASKSVRGRGPRRYRQSFKSINGAPITQHKQSVKPVHKHSYVSYGRTTQPVSYAESDVAQPRKQVASNLNIASPPFYPTGSSTKDNIVVPLKRDIQAGTINRNGQQLRGKNIVDSIGVENLHIDNSPSGMPSNSNNPGQPQLRGQGRGLTSSPQMAYQPAVSKNHFNRDPPSQTHGQSRGQSSLQQGTQRSSIGPQAFSLPKAAGGVNAFEFGEMVSASESKTAVVSKGKGSLQGSGKGPLHYGGAQVMGASGSIGSGDQNFPAFLPVMQFGGQHPGGIGVPAVGMAFPGYVTQPQLGPGSSEMTWLPVLAGAAGALGASYCPSYIPIDGSYNARPSGQASYIAVAVSSKENNAAKIGNDGTPAQRPELANDDRGQRQKNPRRYTEMKFDQ